MSRFNASISTKLLQEYMEILDGPYQISQQQRKKVLQAEIAIEAVAQYADATKDAEQIKVNEERNK